MTLTHASVIESVPAATPNQFPFTKLQESNSVNTLPSAFRIGVPSAASIGVRVPLGAMEMLHRINNANETINMLEHFGMRISG